MPLKPKNHMTRKETALLSLDAMQGQLAELRSQVAADGKLEKIVDLSKTIGSQLATSMQIYVSDREGVFDKPKKRG